MAIKPAINQFNGGELSPYLEGRTDWDKYNYSAKLCKNFIPLVEGSLKRRGGSHFVAKKKAKESYTIEITAKIKGDVIPSIIINGSIVEALDVFYEDEYVLYKVTKDFKDGSLVRVTIRADGYMEINDSFYAPSSPKEYVLIETSTETVVLTVVKAADDMVLKLNGQDTLSYTTVKGVPVVWTATYKGNNSHGTVYLEEDTTMVLNAIDDVPMIAYDGTTMMSTDNASSGTMLLSRGQYRITLVGAGGPAFVLGSNVSPQFQNGPAGGCIDADFNLETNTYSWQVGNVSEEDVQDGWNLSSFAEDTYLSVGSNDIARAKAGSFDGGGKTTIDNSKVAKTYINKAGEGSNNVLSKQTSSALKPYGSGACLTSLKFTSDYAEFSYTPAKTGFIAITYLGEI